MQGEVEAWNSLHSTTPHTLLASVAPEGTCAESHYEPILQLDKMRLTEKKSHPLARMQIFELP